MSKTLARAESIKQDAYLTIIKLARQYKEEGLFNQSEDFYRQAIAMARNLLTGDNDAQKLLLLEALRELAAFYAFQGKEERGESLWLEILEMRKNSLNAGDSIYVESVLGLAAANEKKGDIKKQKLCIKTFCISKKSFWAMRLWKYVRLLKKWLPFIIASNNTRRQKRFI